MDNKELKELIEWQDAGGEIEMLANDDCWYLLRDPIAPVINCVNGRKFRKKEAQKLTREQIMNEWLWDKNSMTAFKVVCVDGHNCYKVIKGENTMSNFEYIQTYCELYTNQDAV